MTVADLPPQTWQDEVVGLAEAGADAVVSGLLPGAGGFIMTAVLNQFFPSGPSVANLSAKALADIANIVQQAIQQAEIDELTAFTTSAAEKLKTYAETKDVALLDNDLFNLFDIVARWQQKGTRTVGGFSMAAGIHLSALLAKAEHIAGYLTTYNRKRVEYGNAVLDLTNQIRQAITSKYTTAFGPCQCKYYYIPHTKPPRPAGFTCQTPGSDPDAGHLIGTVMSSTQDWTNAAALQQCRDECQQKLSALITQKVNDHTQDLVPLEKTAHIWLQ